MQVRRKINAGTRYADVVKLGRDYCDRIAKSLNLPPFVDCGMDGRILSYDRSSEYSYRSKRNNKRYRLLMEADSDFTPRSTNDFVFIIKIYDDVIHRESQQIDDRYRHIKDLTFCGYRFGDKYTGDLQDKIGRSNIASCSVRLSSPYFGFTNACLRLDLVTTNVFEILLSGLKFKADELELALIRYDEICRGIENEFKIELPSPSKSKNANGNISTTVRFLGMNFGDYYICITLRRRDPELSIDLLVRNNRLQEDVNENSTIWDGLRNKNYTPTENDLRIAKELKAWNATNGIDYTETSPFDLKLLCGHAFGEPADFIPRDRIGSGGSGCKLFEFEFGPFRSMHRLFGAQPGHPMCHCHFGVIFKPIAPECLEIPGDYQHEAILLKEKMESMFKIKFEKGINGNYVYEDDCVKADIRFNVQTTQGAKVQKYPLVVDVRDKRLCAEDSFTQKLYRKYERENSNRHGKMPLRYKNYTPTENDLKIAKELKAWNATNGVDYTETSPFDLKLLCGHAFGEPADFIPHDRIGSGGSGCNLFEFEFGPFRHMHRLFGAQPGHPMCHCHFGVLSKPIAPECLEIPGDYQHEAILLKEKMESMFKIKFEKGINGNYVYEDDCVKADIRFNVQITQGTKVRKCPLVVEIRDKRLCAEDSYAQKLYRKYECGNSNRHGKNSFRLGGRKFRMKSVNTNSTDLSTLILEGRSARIIDRKGP